MGLQYTQILQFWEVDKLFIYNTISSSRDTEIRCLKMIKFTVCINKENGDQLFKEFKFPILPRIGEMVCVSGELASPMVEVYEVNYYLTENRANRPKIYVCLTSIDEDDFQILVETKEWRTSTYLRDATGEESTDT